MWFSLYSTIPLILISKHNKDAYWGQVDVMVSTWQSESFLFFVGFGNNKTKALSFNADNAWFFF